MVEEGGCEWRSSGSGSGMLPGAVQGCRAACSAAQLLGSRPEGLLTSGSEAGRAGMRLLLRALLAAHCASSAAALR